MATMNDDGALAQAMVADGTKPKPGVRKKSTNKKARAKAKKPAAAAHSTPKPTKARTLKDVTTLGELCTAYLTALPKMGKSAGTVRSYGADLAVAKKHFGADLAVATLTPAQVAEYFASDPVMKTRTGEPKNPVTTAKIRRVFRLMLIWAAEKRVIETAPLPPKEDA